ncbi:thiamine-phosphate kinase [Akkermansiaceae bacterium]|nr:thiamine-phosphate kinase [bacterium]MDC0286694.1 thiamine-phosphate kinase [Akkermansiaceae bacterium]
MKTVGELGEDPLIAQLCEGLAGAKNVVVGPGDDCAVVREGRSLILLKTDAVVEGVHFLPEAPAKKVGWKAVARVLSDFAAMGGTPEEFLITLALPKETPLRWVRSLYEGMSDCLATHGGVIVGGETTSLPVGAPIMISVAARGRVTSRQLVTRSGGKPGDAIFVTGLLGGSIKGKHLTFTPRLEEAAWLTENFRVRSMMDLSDGLAKDLPRLAKLSGCGFEIDREAIPRTRECSVEVALSDGEDYEILFTISGRSAKKLESAWPASFPKLTRIGTLTADEGDDLSGGWDHFEG